MSNKNDDLTINEKDISLKFNSKNSKDRLIGVMENMVNTREIIDLVNYTCGDCKEYPCFKRYDKKIRAGLFFKI